MQFIANGPDIPDALIQAHEEGRVVFFCGAGISYPAGLPGFPGLVRGIYGSCGTERSPIEDEAFNRGQFDATLDLLEHRLPGQRLTVRRALLKILKPNLRLKGATDTHAALLKLGHDRNGALRLVTTNFDRVFHTAARRIQRKFLAYQAPMLPIPKNSRWNGLVYLHGLLPEAKDEVGLHRLVLTSGDFGLAYLTERWAARFVGELFRNYVVCFVGYSINDPVLRYMMDALAADRMQGESTPQAWAFGECYPGEEQAKTVEWRAKGVEPILYEVPQGTFDHSALHKTLRIWADTYVDGVMGKERIVVSHALSRPSASTRQDNFVGRMLWALSDPTGLPAKRFAEFNPVPSIDWLLEAFSETRFQHGDLVRFGVTPTREADAKLQFSLVHRPKPYALEPSMLLASHGPMFAQWDDVMSHIARWLLRHLNDPALVIWVSERGGQLHDQWLWMIERKLDEISSLEREGKTSELDEVRGHAPNAIPDPTMRTLWRLILSGRLKSARIDTKLYSWQDRLTRDGLTATLRFELRELLAPRVKLRKPFRWRAEGDSEEEGKHLRQLVDWEVELNSDHVQSTFRDVSTPKWRAALPGLVEDFQRVLVDTLDLFNELGGANDRSDRSYWHLPSISAHRQNRGFRNWVFLIELLRDSWLATLEKNISRAREIAHAWFGVPYPTFKRLAIFAAAQGCMTPAYWIGWLTTEGAWWLWAIDTKREVLRLLVLRGDDLSPTEQLAIESAILAGPPREMYRESLEDYRWIALSEHSVWLYLSKLASSGRVLGQDAFTRLNELSLLHPEWRLAGDERDEFSHWMSGTGDPDYEASREIDVAPQRRRELAQWLKKSPTDRRPFYEDTWSDTCRTRFALSLCALWELALSDEWPAARWREALQAWSDQDLVQRSWRYAGPLLKKMPDSELLQIAQAVTWWLEAVSKSITRNESTLLGLSRRVLDLAISDDAGITQDGEPINQPVTEALNHPVGNVTQAVLNVWFKRKPNDDEEIPDDIRAIFTNLCEARIARFRHGRVMLAANAIALFRVDRVWTEHYLLPLFNWTAGSVEARAVWEGFLWSPRLYQPLLTALKEQFLECANHYADLGEHGQQYAAFLTYSALESIDGYTMQDFQSSIGRLPQEGLLDAAQALAQALEGAGDQREEYWKNRVYPFWHRAWPKSRDLATSGIADSLARLCIAANLEFVAALDAVEDWLCPIEHPHYVLDLLSESQLCSRFPSDALRLLDKIIETQSWISQELERCLQQISAAMPSLISDTRYQRLIVHARRRG